MIFLDLMHLTINSIILSPIRRIPIPPYRFSLISGKGDVLWK
jgi:hypothetical protein